MAKKLKCWNKKNLPSLSRGSKVVSWENSHKIVQIVKSGKEYSTAIATKDSRNRIVGIEAVPLKNIKGNVKNPQIIKYTKTDALDIAYSYMKKHDKCGVKR